MATPLPDPELRTFCRDGLTFDVQDGGPRSALPVLLLHGFPQDASAWDLVAPHLHGAGLRTLAPDQRGYSPGASPRDVRAYDVRELVRDVLALADAAGAHRFHLVGHDWGGSVAWFTALAAPSRVASLTVLSTPHPKALEQAVRTADQARRSWYIGAFQLPLVPELVMARTLHRTLTRTGLPAEQASRYARRFGTAESLRGPVGWYRAAGLWRGRGRGPGSPARDPRVQVPTTFVWGRQDFALGRAAAEGTGRFVGADYRFLELDAGHWLPECEPERVADAVVARVEGVGRRGW